MARDTQDRRVVRADGTVEWVAEDVEIRTEREAEEWFERQRKYLAENRREPDPPPPSPPPQQRSPSRYTPARKVVCTQLIEPVDSFVELREWPLSQDARGMVDWGDAASGEGGEEEERGGDDE